MSKDINSLIGDWPYDSEDESKNVRLIRGMDGREKIQVRVPGGLLQWETAGRPDGAQPFGFESLLHYLLNRAGSGGRLTFDDPLHKALDEEIMDYYRRRVAFFRVGEFDRARDDADHNLHIMDILKKHCKDREKVLEHEKWRPFVLMDRCRAIAMAAIQNQSYGKALDAIDDGIEEISGFFRSYDQEGLIAQSQEIRALQEFKFYVREIYDLGLTPREILINLKMEQQKAIEQEDFEHAAEIRKEILRLTEILDPKTGR